MEIQSGTGKHLGEVPNGGALPDGTVSQTLKRADLYRALRDEAVRRGVRIEYGKRLVDAEVTPDGGVVARFEDGTGAEGDLLIGADGIRSRTRRIIDPNAPGARYVPVLNIGGYARGEVAADLDGPVAGVGDDYGRGFTARVQLDLAFARERFAGDHGFAPTIRTGGTCPRR